MNRLLRRMLRLGIDVDGVVADFRSAFRDLARTELHRTPADVEVDLSKSEIDRLWRAVAARTNWWMDLPPYEPEQIARLYSEARRSRWEVFFLTSRPASAGDCVQLQTQVWLERFGFLLPSVLTMPAGARGEVARSLRLDVAVDDRLVNCLEIISASNSKAILVARGAPDRELRDEVEARGIAVVETLEESLDAIAGLQDVVRRRRGRLLRLADWFTRPQKDGPSLPHDPRSRR